MDISFPSPSSSSDVHSLRSTAIHYGEVNTIKLSHRFDECYVLILVWNSSDTNSRKNRKNSWQNSDGDCDDHWPHHKFLDSNRIGLRTHSGGDNPLHVVFGSVFISIFFCISALNFGFSVTNICHRRIRIEHDAFGKPHEQNNWICPVIYLGRNGICRTISFDNRRPQSKCLAS